MTKEERQKRLLAALLVILAVSLGYRAFQGASRDADGPAAQRRLSGSGELARIELPHLELELLRREAASYTPGRDLFRFAEKAPPPQPRPAVERRPAPRPQPRPVARPATPPTPPRPQPPAIDFNYLGSFGPPERRIAVFVKGDEIYNALAGDVLMERFIVDKIGFESADIGFVGFPDAPEARLQAGG